MSDDLNMNKTESLLGDTGVTAKIKAKFMLESAIKAFDIHVITNNGKVTLSGEVDNQSTIDKAIEIAKNTDGATDVESIVLVKI